MTIPSSTFTYQPGEYLHYRTMGSGGVTVVLLHGFASSLHTWDDLAPLFPADTFTLHLLDLKGHGSSAKPRSGDYSPLHNARLVQGYIRARGLRDVAVIGHSFGGLVGLLAALDCPEITRLILIGVPGFPQKIPRFMRLLRLPVIGPLLMAAVPARKLATRGLESVFYHHELISGRLIERYAADYRRKGSARALANTVRQIIPPNVDEISARYGELHIPVLIMGGEYDRVVKPWQKNHLAKELKNSQLIEIPGCGHNPHEEQPERTFAIIMDFLSASRPNEHLPK